MLLATGASYRMWMPVALFAGMRADTLTEAGAVVGADWSHIAPTGKSAAASASSAGGGAAGGVAAAAGAVIVAAGIAFVAITGNDDARNVSSGERPAADAPAVVESAPAGGDDAKSASPDTTLSAARAPVSSRTPPGDGDSPVQSLERSDGPAQPGQRGGRTARR